VADPIVRVRIVAEDRARATIERVQESTRGLQTELRRLGVSLERDVNANFRRNLATLEAARRAFEAGSISVRDFAQAQRAVAAQNEALRARLGSTAQEARRASQGFSLAGLSLSQLALRFTGVTAALSLFASGIRNAVQQSQALGEIQRLVDRLAVSFADGVDRGVGFVRSLTGIREEGERWRGLAEIFEKVGTAVGVLVDALFNLPIEAVSGAVAHLERGFIRLAQTLAGLLGQLNELSPLLDRLIPDAALERFRQWAESAERARQLAEADAAATAALNRVLKEQGVTLAELVPASERRAAAEAAIADALERKLINEEKAAILLERVQRGNRGLTDSAKGASEGLRDQAAASGEASEGLRDYSAEQRRAGAENDRYAATARRAAAAQAALNAQQGIVARSSGGQGRIDAAVAAGRRITLVQGGTRARILNGGSVLVGSG
jgi:hypothetical protein